MDRIEQLERSVRRMKKVILGGSILMIALVSVGAMDIKDHIEANTYAIMQGNNIAGFLGGGTIGKSGPGLHLGTKDLGKGGAFIGIDADGDGLLFLTDHNGKTSFSAGGPSK